MEPKIGLTVNYKTTSKQRKEFPTDKKEIHGVVMTVIDKDTVNLRLESDKPGAVPAIIGGVKKGDKEGCWNFIA